jgi:hypothetical protein
MGWVNWDRVGFLVVAPAVAATGYAAGRLLWARDCCRISSLASLAGVVLSLCALFHRASSSGERLAALGVLLYLGFAVMADPFAWAGDREDAVPGLVWLVPVVVGSVVLPQRGYHVAGAACWALLLAGTVALTYSATHWGSGVGLFYAWLE